MSRWSPDAALRLEAAALDLFERQGFESTTVPEIASAAGLTTRTFFRHFSDKREVLFLRDGEFPYVVGELLDHIPPEANARDAVLLGLRGAATQLETSRPTIERRWRVIRREPKLRERELLKSAHLAEAIGNALQVRGESPEHATLLAALAACIFDQALERWLGSADDRLDTAVDRVWSDTQRAMSG